MVWREDAYVACIYENKYIIVRRLIHKTRVYYQTMNS